MSKNVSPSFLLSKHFFFSYIPLLFSFKNKFLKAIDLEVSNILLVLLLSFCLIPLKYTMSSLSLLFLLIILFNLLILLFISSLSEINGKLLNKNFIILFPFCKKFPFLIESFKISIISLEIEEKLLFISIYLYFP